MKKMNLVMLLCFLATVGNSFAQSKFQLIGEIIAYKKSIVSNASFDKTDKEVWNAIYLSGTEKYPNIVRESESRGYLEAKQETSTYREVAIMELIGEAAPYRVAYQIKKDRKTKQDNGTYTDWQAVSYVGDTELTALQTRVYEILNGKVEVSKELLEKIETYNAKQTKERKKLKKGIDY